MTDSLRGPGTATGFSVGAVAFVAVLFVAGCTSGADTQATSPAISASATSASSASPVASAQASNGEGANAAVDDSDNDSSAAAPTDTPRAEPALPEITPGNLDQGALASACTHEGMVWIAKGKDPSPALEVGDEAAKGASAKDGAADSVGTFRFEGVVKADGVDAASFSLDRGAGAQKLDPAKVGDTFELAGHTYAVSSVCEDSAELDVIR